MSKYGQSKYGEGATERKDNNKASLIFGDGNSNGDNSNDDGSDESGKCVIRFDYHEESSSRRPSYIPPKYGSSLQNLYTPHAQYTQSTN